MPAAFKKCIKKGGKVRTLKIKKEKFMHICILHGQAFVGEVKERKKRKKKK